MANNYLQVSMAFPLKTEAEKTWCLETMKAFVALIDSAIGAETPATATQKKLMKLLGGLGQRVVEEGWEVCDFQWSVDPITPKETSAVAQMWIYAEEAGDPDQVAAFLQAYLQKFNPTGSLWFSWAYTCSKMRVNEFGGGAAIVTSDAIKFIDAQQWAQEEAEKASSHSPSTP